MDNGFYSIVEKLAILEGRIDPKDKPATEPKQKKPALFTNLKKEEKTDEMFMPMVSGVEFAEEKSLDVLSKVKASLADYLKSAEEDIKQDKDLIAKKKQDLDLKKKELKDLELQAKTQEEVEEAIPDTLEEDQELQIGDPVEIIGDVQFSGATGEIVDFGQRSNFIIVNLYNHGTHSFNAANVEYNQYADDEDADEYGEYEDDLDEDPNQTPAGGEAMSTLTDPTYAESAPVKTTNVEWTSGGGSVLVEIHGDERDGFCIRRAGKELPTRFKSLEEAETALELFQARQKARLAAEESADYIQEK